MEPMELTQLTAKDAAALRDPAQRDAKLDNLNFR